MRDLKKDKFQEFTSGETQKENMQFQFGDIFGSIGEASANIGKDVKDKTMSILEMRKKLFKKEVIKVAKEDIEKEIKENKAHLKEEQEAHQKKKEAMDAVKQGIEEEQDQQQEQQ